MTIFFVKGKQNEGIVLTELQDFSFFLDRCEQPKRVAQSDMFIPFRGRLHEQTKVEFENGWTENTFKRESLDVVQSHSPAVVIQLRLYLGNRGDGHTSAVQVQAIDFPANQSHCEHVRILRMKTLPDLVQDIVTEAIVDTRSKVAIIIFDESLHIHGEPCLLPGLSKGTITIQMPPGLGLEGRSCPCGDEDIIDTDAQAE